MSVDVTATDHIIFNPSAQVEAFSGRERSGSPLPKSLAKRGIHGLYREYDLSLSPVESHPSNNEGWGTPRLLLTLGSAVGEVFRPKHLENLGLAFPAWPVFLVKLHKAHR